MGEKLIFKGENLWLGNLGHAWVVIAFVAAASSIFWYFSAYRNHEDIEKRNAYLSFARKAFWLNIVSIIGVFVTLFIIILTHRYEYHYAWKHSSNDLPIYYMISCFWEGQEGSFLLWMFWIAVLGAVLMKVKDAFEAPVMMVMAMMQLVLGSMILGIELPWFNIGSSPFVLTRDELPDLLNIPVLQTIGKENYLSTLKDGNGLNPLLQNYWMVIHPPTLFLGFALATVPFAYSVAGFFTNKIRQVINPALIWSLLCVGIMGTGIIMGGFWAYESLSFGGYWAWDPVENASLMPWLIAASAAHLLLISRSTGRHLFTSHLLTQIAFWLVLYATFLTRSGILGNASVHSFTDLGLSGQLLILLFAFMALSLAVLPLNKKIGANIMWFFLLVMVVFIGLHIVSETYKMNVSKAFLWTGFVVFPVFLFFYIRTLYQRTKTDMPDETLFSRELWMLLGSLFLILCLIQVFVGTSMPVFNKLFNLNNAVPKAEDYNKIQLWLAMPVMILMGFGQYLNYKDTTWKWIKSKLLWSISLTILLAMYLIWVWDIKELGFQLFLFSSVFLVVGNTVYSVFKGKFQLIRNGATIAHAGFGILLLGILISSVNKKVLTASELGINLFSEAENDPKAIKENRENKVFYLNEPVNLGEFEVNYRGYKQSGIDKYFEVLYARKDKKGEVKDSFILFPQVQNNPKMGLLANPDTRHFLHKDIFTHINFESDLERQEPFSGFKRNNVTIGEPFLTESGKVKLTVIDVQVKEKSQTDSNFKVEFLVKAERLNQIEYLKPSISTAQEEGILPGISNTMGVMASIDISKIPSTNNGNANAKDLILTVETAEREPVKQFIVMKIIEFPWINLVWLGTIVMVFGVTMSVINRIKTLKWN